MSKCPTGTLAGRTSPSSGSLVRTKTHTPVVTCSHFVSTSVECTTSAEMAQEAESRLVDEINRLAALTGAENSKVDESEYSVDASAVMPYLVATSPEHRNRSGRPRGGKVARNEEYQYFLRQAAEANRTFVNEAKAHARRTSSSSSSSAASAGGTAKPVFDLLGFYRTLSYGEPVQVVTDGADLPDQDCRTGAFASVQQSVHLRVASLPRPLAPPCPRAPSPWPATLSTTIGHGWTQKWSMI
uniref:Uncharacterized protein n=1 Tax=Sexangularia sp. CB-2014 TaxID=1486929 RepID=A0A7S1YAY9_9EUKA